MISKPKVLVVDDKRENLIAMKDLLQDFDLELVMVTSGIDAMSEVLTNNFAFVLLDVHMPEVNGFETAEMLRRNESSKSMPIIFVTAQSVDEHIMFKGYEAGAVDFLYKPIERKLLRSKVGVFIEIFRQKNELERSNNALQEFAHLASHDLKAPLRQVSKLTEMLREDFNNRNQEDFNQSLTHIKRSISRMNDLVMGLLSFAELGAKPPQFEEVSLNNIIDDVLYEYRLDIQKHSITVNVDKLPIISCSTFHIRQAMHNLIGNSIKYKDKKRPLIIEITHLKDNDPSRCVFAIKDNGIGFSEENSQAIFKPFKRAVGVSEYDGSGIGLATVKKAIELHNGKVVASSMKGKGATFTIYLPLSQN